MGQVLTQRDKLHEGLFVSPLPLHQGDWFVLRSVASVGGVVTKAAAANPPAVDLPPATKPLEPVRSPSVQPASALEPVRPRPSDSGPRETVPTAAELQPPAGVASEPAPTAAAWAAPVTPDVEPAPTAAAWAAPVTPDVEPTLAAAGAAAAWAAPVTPDVEPTPPPVPPPSAAPVPLATAAGKATFGFYFPVFNQIPSVLRVVADVRRYYPESPIHLLQDGANVDFSEVLHNPRLYPIPHV